MVTKVIRVFLTMVFVTISQTISEDPFCGNKCHNTGVSTSRNCHCESSCAYTFGDCCGDSDYVSLRFQRQSYPVMSCELLGDGKHTLIVNTCKKDWDGPEIVKTSCLQSSNSFLDPVGGTPITNPSSGITYRSFYCALCNGDAQSMIFWKLNVHCPTLQPNVIDDKDSAMRYIFYNRTAQEWGFRIREEGIVSFHGCDVNYTVPQEVTSKIHSCDPEEVETCSSTWKQDTIRYMCGTYKDPVYANNTRYKNFYCAICNHVDQSQMTCGPAVGPRSPDFGTANFALLLDMNLSDGNTVGRTLPASEQCAKGEMYDPFKKTCRNVVCGIPGYHVEDGKCTKT